MTSERPLVNRQMNTCRLGPERAPEWVRGPCV